MTTKLQYFYDPVKGDIAVAHIVWQIRYFKDSTPIGWSMDRLAASLTMCVRGYTYSWHLSSLEASKFLDDMVEIEVAALDGTHPALNCYTNKVRDAILKNGGEKSVILDTSGTVWIGDRPVPSGSWSDRYDSWLATDHRADSELNRMVRQIRHHLPTTQTADLAESTTHCSLRRDEPPTTPSENVGAETEYEAYLKRIYRIAIMG